MVVLVPRSMKWVNGVVRIGRLPSISDNVICCAILELAESLEPIESF